MAISSTENHFKTAPINIEYLSFFNVNRVILDLTAQQEIPTAAIAASE